MICEELSARRPRTAAATQPLLGILIISVVRRVLPPLVTMLLVLLSYMNYAREAQGFPVRKALVQYLAALVTARFAWQVRRERRSSNPSRRGHKRVAARPCCPRASSAEARTRSALPAARIRALAPGERDERVTPAGVTRADSEL